MTEPVATRPTQREGNVSAAPAVCATLDAARDCALPAATLPVIENPTTRSTFLTIIRSGGQALLLNEARGLQRRR
eukprot:CAMPEP_0181214722 /NCGR_PEP_ID=MMETSP1096-20121128/25617_1 /TAXON_ID=156174 ORGANISM="Chrysochromulina ericina, Strain CCMP281" /NCGR_SAMPLE_ID=MMETSP1096 /ASSEMBLY_ACC=CAM_ASM_000453 /LENGTH=74 /DNA_ID=CAMNT_0023306501 /DNA_START=399 /DNA_END=620 /DNA_ORIENTATION=+